MMMNPVSLEAESAVIRADAPRQGKPILRGEPQEQTRKGYAARARKKEAEATRLKAASDAEANAGREKCVSRPGSSGRL
jgi:regulator of protease activity HflC (stomatin/prohibitin superfamily)